MDEEPRFFGDLLPPDDPRPGDVWLARGIYRVRLKDKWEPDWSCPDGKAYRKMLLATWHRAGVKAWATRERKRVIADTPCEADRSAHLDHVE
jgi:hypothetical protein